MKFNARKIRAAEGTSIYDGPVLRFVVESEIDDSNISIYQTVASIKPLAAE